MHKQHAHFINSSFVSRLVVASLVAVPLMCAQIAGSDFTLVGKAYAQQGQGKGSPGTGGGAGQGGKGAAGGGAAGGGSGGGGVKVPSTSTSKLGRLNMARALVSPGFDITNVDDPLAPIAQVATAVSLLSSALSGTEEDQQAAITAAGTAIGNAATVNPVTAETVSKMVDLAGETVHTTWSDSLTQVAEIATQVIVDRRSEEGE